MSLSGDYRHGCASRVREGADSVQILSILCLLLVGWLVGWLVELMDVDNLHAYWAFY